MEKNTILAIVLSVIIITVGMGIQTKFFSPEQTSEVQAAPTQTVSQESTVIETPSYKTAAEYGWASNVEGSLVALETDIPTDIFKFETNVFIIEFDPIGASVKSLKLKKHLAQGSPVELIFNDGSSPNPFSLYVGNNKTNPLDAPFKYKILEDRVEFSQMFAIVGKDGNPTDESFALVKTFRFGADDYLFELAIELKNTQNKAIGLNYDGFAYTLAFEPQLGPAFHETPDGNYTYRRFYIEQNGKKSRPKLKDGTYQTSDHLSWVAIAGKYFSVIGITDAASYTTTLQEGKSENILLESRLYFSRTALRTANSKDVFRFYVGPQLKANMAIYNKADDNGFGLSDLNLEKAIDSSTWLGWLESILKWLLAFFYRLIPNYGIAIILLTILIKIVLQPFTKKSMDSTAKMQSLNPQMEELRAKYKDNPTKLNQEMGDLYKKEGINPIGGCLPMLLQFPIFIALYGLLNKHFELRGALFIPGWIEDLSMPETIWNFAPVSLPVIGSNIRLLPIFYVASMILSFRINQAGTQQSGMSGKFMMLGMPIMFFFILYNAPSGLLLYWMVMNFISIGQQVFVNSRRNKKQAEAVKKPQFKGKKG
jgi:YidC/Oxa1 family membrane protein insertase